jgi:hypothetical protein
LWRMRLLIENPSIAPWGHRPGLNFVWFSSIWRVGLHLRSLAAFEGLSNQPISSSDFSWLIQIIALFPRSNMHADRPTSKQTAKAQTSEPE